MLAGVVLTGCSGSFQPDICTIVNTDTLECVPVNRAKDPFDLTTREALGYTCFSPNDFGEAKKRARAILEGLD